jgi:hypothetical protein
MNLVKEKPDPGGTITVIGKGRKSPLKAFVMKVLEIVGLGGTCETA